MARTELYQLRDILRGMTEAGTADYTVGTINYWDDAALDQVLDQHREDLYFAPLEAEPFTVAGGSLLYTRYCVEDFKNFEQTQGGTAVFYIQDSTGAVQGTANPYAVDYLRGIVTFTNDQRGTAYYLTGRSYDLDGAAADIWRKKAGHVSSSAWRFSTDNHSVDRTNLAKQYMENARMYESRSGFNVTMGTMEREDME